ncbi:MAG: hypothetical protein ACXACG_16995 [Candidatus Thorarchaeota archaeon]
MTNTSDILKLKKPINQVGISEVSDVWYHDCTNLTGFTDITDSSWFYPFNSSDTIVSGDIGVGTSWIQANDVGSGSGWHGPVKSIPLSNPFKISELVRFEARIGFDSSVGSQLGGIRVMLHDSNQRVICQFNIFDSWADDKQLKMPAHWAFLNGSYTGTPWSEPDWVTFAPYDETLTILQNSTGFYAVIPEIGDFRLNVGPNDDLDREVSYVSVWFAGNDGYSFCDSVYLHSLSLEWAQVEDLPNTWHHDCSNTTGFISQSSWDTSWYSAGWTVSDGNLLSSGNYLSISNIPIGTGWHGPIFTYEFDTTFNVSDVIEFSADIQIDNTVTAYDGRYYLYLADSNHNPTYVFTTGDHRSDLNQGVYGSQYWFENGTYFGHGSPYPYTYTQFNGRMEVGLNETHGVYGYVDGFGEGVLTPLDDSEQSREIKYLVFMGGRADTQPLMPTWIHDINLTTRVPITTTHHVTWHHDCSNITAFDGVGDDTWLWEHSTPDLLTTLGTLNSSGQYIYSADLGVPPVDRCWFGPLRYHSLATPFQFYGFRTLDVEFEINPNGQAGATGGIFVALHDESGRPIVTVRVRDPFIATTEIYPGAAWHFSNGTMLTPGVGAVVSSPYHNTITMELNETGLYAILPGAGEGLIAEYDDLEDRQVSYISIWIAGSKEASSPPWPHTDIVRVHDIRMTYIIAEISSPDDLEYEFGMTGNNVTWTLSAEVGNPYIIYLDEGVLDSGTCDGQTISISTDSFSVDLHNLTVWCNTTYGIVNDTVWVQVHPSTPPTMDHPPDVTYVVGETGNTIEWYPIEMYPSSFSLYLDGVVEESGSWNGSSFIYNVDGYDVGVVEYLLNVFDLAGNNNSDLVMVHILAEPDVLTIDHPDDIVYNVGNTGNNITWTPSSYYPGMYQLFVNNELVDSGLWFGDQIVVDVDGLSPGIYNYTLRVLNIDEESVSDEVIVTVLGQTADGTLLIMSISIGSIAVIVVVIGVVCRRRSGGTVAHPSSYDW